MDFCKNNWTRIAFSAMFLVGLVLMLIYIFTLGNEYVTPSFMQMAASIGLAVFFLGMLTYYVCTMFSICKCVRAWILIATGLLVGFFITCTIIEIMDITNNRFATFPLFAQLIGFGLFPLVKGIRLLLNKTPLKQYEAEN
ncbi:MAG: hypothetical protein FWE45_00465 [Firmicutes bacterium]|nr:hypothetical protein [Bacillota bacterium]